MRIGVFARVSEHTLPITDLARALEARDIESLWLPEHTHIPVASETDSYHDANTIEISKYFPSPFVLLTAAAAVTERLRVGTGICIVAQYDPLIFAKQVATLDMVSGGRVELGCGYGWNRAELQNHGIDPHRRRTAFREALRAIESLWAQDVAEASGAFVSFSPSWSWPKPVQRPRPPILIGAPGKPETFRDIIELADGWIPSTFFAGAALGDQIAQLRAMAREAGRPQNLAITLLETRAAMERLSPEEFTERCPSADQVETWAALGVRRVVLGVPLDSRDGALAMLDHVAALARRVA